MALSITPWTSDSYRIKSRKKGGHLFLIFFIKIYI